jgi:hypothetical protein
MLVLISIGYLFIWGKKVGIYIENPVYTPHNFPVFVSMKKSLGVGIESREYGIFLVKGVEP